MDGLLNGVTSGLLANLSAVGVLSIAVLGILRGWLVPGRLLDAMLAVHEKRLAELNARGDEWKAVAIRATERADERDKQTERLLEVVNTTITLMETLRRAAEVRDK
jgi:hypothetical protein